MIKTKRTSKKHEKDDGFRVLVERAWPRGLSKTDGSVDLWLPDLAPSDVLRKWFSHDPRKWDTFRARYETELAEKEELVEQLKKLEDEKGTITLLYSSKNEEFNDAVVLKNILFEVYQL